MTRQTGQPSLWPGLSLPASTPLGAEPLMPSTFTAPPLLPGADPAVAQPPALRLCLLFSLLHASVSQMKAFVPFMAEKYGFDYE